MNLTRSKLRRKALIYTLQTNNDLDFHDYYRFRVWRCSDNINARRWQGKIDCAHGWNPSLYGGSEMADYHVMSAARNLSEPYVSQARGVTDEKLVVSKDLSPEGVWNSAKCIGRWLVCLLGTLGIGWVVIARSIEYVIRRTKRISQQWDDSSHRTTPSEMPIASMASTADKVLIGVETVPILSGPTSGDISEDDARSTAGCHADKVVFGNNYLRPVNRNPCKSTGMLKTDLMYGGSFIASSGNVISSKQCRVEVKVCKPHLGEYLERRKDVGCEKPECYARGVMVRIGDIVVRECNEHIGIRLIHTEEDAHEMKPISNMGKTSEEISSKSPGMINRNSQTPSVEKSLLPTKQGMCHPQWAPEA